MKHQKQKSGEKIPFDVATRKIKSRNKLNQGVKRLYSENYTTLRKKLRKTQRNRSMYHAHGLEELTSSKWPYYPKRFIDSMQSLLKYP